MGMFASMDISASALMAERMRMDTFGNNLANMQTLREDNQRLRPFRRRTPIFASGAPGFTGSDKLGVSFKGVAYSDKFIARPSPDPENDPDAVRAEDVAARPELADYVGQRLFPDINMAIEMTDMIAAARSYEANITAMQLSRSVMQSTLQLLA